MKELGIRDVFIVVGYLKEEIFRYLVNGDRFGVNIRYVVQEKPLGNGHAVGLLEEPIQQPFLLFLGDICIKVNKLKAQIESLDLDGQWPFYLWL